MANKVPKVKFYNGNEVPVLGLGTWQSKPGEVTQAVKDAIDIGYRHIDCARIYLNEKEIGEALKAKFAEGVIKREDIFITSKLWLSFYSPDLVETCLTTTLNDLGLEYVDLYLMHWPFAFKEGGELVPRDADGNVYFSDVDYIDTWKVMESLCDKGLAKNIGISNFNSQQITRLLENCRIKPVTNQVECNPQYAQLKLSEFCKSKGITITAYSPLGCPNRSWAKPEDPVLMDEPEIKEIALKHGKTPAQILLRYQIDRGHIVIPKSVAKSRLQDNFDIFDFKLAKEDVERINKNDRDDKICDVSTIFPNIKEHPHYPFGIEF